MPRKEMLKYILDIESVISELEDIIEMHDYKYGFYCLRINLGLFF